MSASENKVPQGTQVVAGVSMRDLLAAGLAAKVVSTPPRGPEAGAQTRRPAAEQRHRDAA
ncbi:hypothetical protein [Streptomyces sp. NPDC057740]|uniref:hypothetical protein n=1 Tax=Streptomyces sp. NPDC057740 TaxID=3346234 RepID=UPI00369A0C96